ncbi:MAG: ABC-F family ATP-binding cassette domain-containing protein [Candidatus Omnitrophica bacterium]|nr:ABC-F family ATP-binding cassette domain-containing protein [Candidatus Omnitrophota bacterium]
MIHINNLSKSYGKRYLFKDVSLAIRRGEKVGLIGPNGAGKSTFFSLILKGEPAITVRKNIRIGFLRQESEFSSKRTVLGEITCGDEKVTELLAEKKKLEQEDLFASSRYSKILADLEFLGFYEIEHKAKKILMGLGFKETDFDRQISELSGGWQMRTQLAKLLTVQYDLLLLDEPMNYLDLTAALWFKDYLRDFNQTFIMISHDLDFLTDITTHTVVLEHSQMTKIRGTYSDYRRLTEENRQLQIKRFNEQEKKVEQLKRFISRFHGQPNKASQVRSKKKLLEKMEKIVVPLDRRDSIRKFVFPATKKSGYQVAELIDISKAYGDLKVYKNFSFEITQGEKAVFIGDNGAGKSTLLKILAGVVPIDSGSRRLGYNVELGYFSQTRMDVLNATSTVYEEAYSAAEGALTTENIRTILAAFFFVGDDVDKPVSVLSGGEKSRLILAKLLINPPNFLLLDEPTTHLDVDAVDALIKSLNDYQGTLLFISHDIHFVRSVATSVFEVNNGKVRKFPGGLDYYLNKAKEKSQVVGSFSQPDYIDQRTKEKDLKLNDSQKKADEFKLRKERKAHNMKVAKEIKSLQKKKDSLEIERNVKAKILSNPQSYHNKDLVIEYGKLIKKYEQEIKTIEANLDKLNTSFKSLD